MADQKISELTALTGANVADDDAIAIVDTSATETKKIVFSELKNALVTATGFVRITGDTMTGALDVQSTITSDGLTVDGGVSIQNDAASFSISNAAVDRYQRFRRNASNSLILDKYNGSTTTNTAKFDENGDISFFEDTGTTAKFFWDASAESLGIGTSSPSARLHIKESSNLTEGDPHFKIEGLGYSGFHWLDATAYYIGQNSSIRQVRIYSGAETAGVALTNGSTSWGTFSDERLKYDVENIENAVETLSGIRTVKYRLNNVDAPDAKKKLGVIAQDLEGVLDEVVDTTMLNDDDTEYMSVRYTELIPVLIKAIQEQQATITALEARITALENT